MSVVVELVLDFFGEVLFWPGAALWTRLTARAEGHSTSVRVLLLACAVLIVAGFYVLLAAVIVGLAILAF